MKVILLKNVPKIGKANEIKDLPDGYVRNFIIPQKLGIIATPDAVNKLQHAQSEAKVGREIQSDLFKKNLRAVHGAGVTIAAKTNAEGHLYKAVGPKDVVAALKKEHHIAIEEKYVFMEPIKQTGTFSARVEALDVKEQIEVTVVSE